MKKAEYDVQIHQDRKMIEVDRIVENYRKEQFRKVEDEAVTCNRDLASYEHTYHAGMEEKKVALAKLDALIESKTELIAKLPEFEAVRAERDKFKALSEAKDTTISGKDKTIELLNENMKVVVGRLSKMDIGALTLNVPKQEVSKE